MRENTPCSAVSQQSTIRCNTAKTFIERLERGEETLRLFHGFHSTFCALFFSSLRNISCVGPMGYPFESNGTLERFYPSIFDKSPSFLERICQVASTGSRPPFLSPSSDVAPKSPLADCELEAAHHPVFRMVGTNVPTR